MNVFFRPLESLASSRFSPLLRHWRNSEAVRSQMRCQREISEAEHLIWYKNVASLESFYRLRVAFADDDPFGVIYLSDIDLDSKNSSWGMYIGEDRFLGRGLSKLMLKELLSWGFGELSLYRMYTSVLEGNEKALKLYQQIGFKIEGVWRRHVVCQGNRRDIIWIGMLRDEWLCGTG